MDISGSITVVCIEKYTKRETTIVIAAESTVQNLREALAVAVKRKAAGILLFEGEDYLQNHVRLDQYDIRNGATLIYEARMCGVLPLDYDWSKSGIKTKRFAF